MKPLPSAKQLPDLRFKVDDLIGAKFKTAAQRDEAIELNARNITWVLCATCGWPTALIVVKRCQRCYDLENELTGYLKSGRGRAFVRRRLAEAVRMRE